jgi:hypothetical protein
LLEGVAQQSHTQKKEKKKEKEAETSFTLNWVPTTKNYGKLIFCNKLLTCALAFVSEL